MDDAKRVIGAGPIGPPPAPRASRRFPRWARALLSVAGLALLVFLILKVGAATVLGYIVDFGPWFLVIVGLGFGWIFLQAWAWSLIQAAHFRPVPLGRLFRAKLISDSLNTLIPTANLGGDAVRPLLIKRQVPLEEGIPSVLVDKTAEGFAAALFLVSGLPPQPGPAPPAALDEHRRDALSRGHRGRDRPLHRHPNEGIPRAAQPDREGLPPGPEIHRQARRLHPDARRQSADRLSMPEPRTAAAVALHYAARLVGVAEVYVILRVLGAHASALQALFTSTGVTIINTAFFIVPGQFGVAESAHALVLQSLGFPAALGLSLGVIRRIRKMATASVGLALYAAQTPPRSKPGAKAP